MPICELGVYSLSWFRKPCRHLRPGFPASGLEFGVGKKPYLFFHYSNIDYILEIALLHLLPY